MKDNKKKYLIIGIIVAIIAVIAVIFSSTYAYWQLTRKQTSPNDVVALCLDLSIENETGTFGLSKAWPITDEEGKTLEGLTFEVKNNCDKPINYIVGLNSVQTETNDNYMSYDSIKVMIDERTPLLYGDLGKVEYANAEDTSVVRDSRQLSLEKIEGGATNTHNVKAWVDIDSDVSNQGKTFSGKIFITGGQGIYGGDDCYKIASNGIIWGYDDACTTNINVPEKINGIAVKRINKASFTNADVYLAGLVNIHTNSAQYVVVHLQDENIEEIELAMLNLICQDLDSCTATKLSDVATVYNSYEDFASVNLSNYTIEASLVYKYNTKNSTLEDVHTKATHLNLSDAKYLETIEIAAFFGKKDESSNLCSGKELLGNNKDGFYCIVGELNSLVLPQNGSLLSINDSAFAYNHLQSVVIPDTVTTLGSAAFDNNELTTVTISKNITSLEENVFRANDINKIIIPEKVTTIKISAFQGNKIDSLLIPSSVETIGKYAFDNNGLNSIMFEDTKENPSQLKTIEGGAFTQNQIKTLDLPERLEKIDSWAFGGNLISELVIPSSVVIINLFAFTDNQITSLVFEDTAEKPSNLTTIGKEAFRGNNISSVVVIPTSVTKIDEWVFLSNTSLPQVVIKRTEDDARVNMTLDDEWNLVQSGRKIFANVLYNPNYTE